MGGYPEDGCSVAKRERGAAHSLLRSVLAGVGLIVVAGGLLSVGWIVASIVGALLGA